MTIKQTVRYSFECELCSYRAPLRLTVREASRDQGEHWFEFHPSWVAEREAAREAAEGGEL